MDIFRRYATTFAALRVIYWPFVWLQIWRVLAFTKRTGRKVLFTFTPRGRMIIKFIADAPCPANLYAYTAPALQAWRRPSLATDLPEMFLTLACYLSVVMCRFAGVVVRSAKIATDRRILIPP